MGEDAFIWIDDDSLREISYMLDDLDQLKETFRGMGMPESDWQEVLRLRAIGEI